MKRKHKNMHRAIHPGFTHTFVFSDLELLIDYMWLHTYDTKLKYDVFVDSGESFVRERHPLNVVVRNGQDLNCGEFFPISVSRKPQILDRKIAIKSPLMKWKRLRNSS